MGFKKVFETVRHTVTPSSVAETVRHIGAVGTISFIYAGKIIAENTHHIAENAQELSRHLTATPSFTENVEHIVSVLGEDVRHEIAKLIIETFYWVS